MTNRASIRQLAFVTLAATSVNNALTAQAPIPDPHWGASAFPSPTSELRLTFSFNRFTEFDNSNNEFNDTHQTSGFDIGSISWTDQMTSFPSFTYTTSFGIGVSRDQPTRFFQNDVIHAIRGIDQVPVGETRSETEYFAGLGMNWWPARQFRDYLGHETSAGLLFEPFLGGGGTASTIYDELYGHAGLRLTCPIPWTDGSAFRISAMERLSWPTGGDAYPDVAQYTRIDQFAFAFVPGPTSNESSLGKFYEILLGSPELELIFSHDSGLFLDHNGNSIPIQFVSFRVKWATGLMFETWNDLANKTDFGPTYGFQVSLDVLTMLRTYWSPK